MTRETLKYIRDALGKAGINYEFGEWSREIKYPYFTGEYQESPTANEDGCRDTAFILNGFSRGLYLELEKAKETIENTFTHSATILESGQGLSIEYDGALIIQTNDAELKRIQINLTIKEWRVK